MYSSTASYPVTTRQAFSLRELPAHQVMHAQWLRVENASPNPWACPHVAGPFLCADCLNACLKQFHDQRHVYACVLGRMGLREASADEAFQDALTRAWRSITRHGAAHIRKPKAWFLRIVQCCAYDRQRDEVRRATVPIENMAEALPMPVEVFEDWGWHEVQLHRVVRAVADLKDEYRRAIELVCYAGYSYAKAAKEMGISEDSLRGLLVRARKRLRRIHGLEGKYQVKKKSRGKARAGFWRAS